jgi:hypothetical protein
MNASLTFAEPRLITKHMPSACYAVASWVALVLTHEQQMRIDMFLAPLLTWSVGPTTGDASWQVTSCFAPRLHRNGEIDFVAPYLAGSHALALITAQPTVTFLVSDKEQECWLEGCAQTEVVQRSWEQAELLAYLQWRIPDAIDGFGDGIKVLVFHPTYLRYYDRWCDSSSFEAP